ncbi:MAG: DUF4147 domain-containing protein [Gemmatirosa sp.]|nr:DUF4147 domain-containing protein [Gemmatirosa sp.]
MAPMTARATLERLHAAAIAGVDPARTTAAAVHALALRERGGVHVIALGKAAAGMATAAVAALARRGVEPAGGLVVAATPARAPHPAVPVVFGDHPIPAARSLAAARRLGDAAAAVGPDDLAVVLLSGGTSSLVGAPVAGLTGADLAALTDALLGAGVDIAVVNATRRRVTRWGAGRLALALAPARVACLVVSDVPGYGAALVGSGPCAPETLPIGDLLASLHDAGTWPRLPAAARMLLGAMRDGARPDAPPPTDPAFARVTLELLADNGIAVAAVAAAARAAGFAVLAHDEPLAGEARALGERLAGVLAAGAPGTVHVWGGEPAVTLHDAPADALGGRMQELALAAAGALARTGAAATLLAAGTDGRDGPTDAAGAVVDGGTWERIATAGRDPAADLAAHRSHAALDAAGALLRTGPTGTNVADVVIGLVGGP